MEEITNEIEKLAEEIAKDETFENLVRRTVRSVRVLGKNKCLRFA